MFSWLWARIAGALNTLASLIIFLILVVAVITVIGLVNTPTVADQTVLKLDLRKPLTDSPSANPFAGESTSLLDVVAALAKAEDDPKVKGVFIRVGGAGVSMAAAEELREAIKSFRAKKKFAVTFAQAFYSSGMSEYYVASATDEIWLQPVSEMNTSGFAATTLFFKDALAKINAKAEIGRRYEFKNAGNPFLESDFTEAHREATGRLLQSLFDNAVAGSSADRKMDAAQFKALIDAAPYLTQEALDKKLIDRQGYDDEAEKAALDRAGKNAKLMTPKKYLEIAGHPWMAKGPEVSPSRIAFVSGDGQINDGKSQGGGFGEEQSMGGDTVAEQIRKATEDKSIRVILFRVNSPGGSALASDQMLNAVKKAQKAGKKVVVSMGSLAASGGYYVSLSADKIIAWPSTITGSIGVVGGKLVIGQSLEMLGINARTIKVGANAGMNSEYEVYTPEQLAKRDAGLDAIYNDFTAKVAEGRKIPLEKVREMAKGRVWSGSDAKERGLVDSFGGYRAALEEAKKLAGLSAGDAPSMKNFSTPASPFEAMAEAFGTSVEVVKTLSMLSRAMEAPGIKELIGAAAEEGEKGEGAGMRMAPTPVR